MKRILSFAILAFLLVVPSVAQKGSDKVKLNGPYTFVGLQGGAQNTYDTQYAFGRTWTPSAALSVGHFFSKDVGARLNFNGVWAKGNAPFQNAATQQFDFKYLTSSADLLFNMNSIWTRGYSPFNVYMIGGFGWNHSWDNAEALELHNAGSTIMFAEKDHQNAFNLRLGLQLEYNICKNVAVNVEADYNYLAYGKTQKFINEHNRFTAFAGLNFKFGYKKNKENPVVEEIWATRIDTTWYDETIYTPRTENDAATWEVFYEIRESNMENADDKLQAIGNFLKDYHDCKISVKSYADRGTGNPSINMNYSKQRSEKAVKALVDAGVDERLITAEYFGDTIQPYAENDKNRVTIIKATGLKDVKDKGLQRKFRTKEVRYRVQ